MEFVDLLETHWRSFLSLLKRFCKTTERAVEVFMIALCEGRV